MPLFDRLSDKLSGLMKEKLGGHDSGHDSNLSSYEGHGSQHDSQRAYDGNQPSHYEQQQPYGSISQLPPGWIQQWDANSQRYYYVEQATGRTQWEPPMMYGNGAVPGQHLQYGQPGYGDEAYRGAYHAQGGQKDRNTGLTLAGGAALGAVGGAWAMHEYNENQEEDAAAVAAATQPTSNVPRGDPSSVPPGNDTIYVPAEAAGSDVESAAEDVQSEREDVQDAQEELAEASSESDREEAREELEEEQEQLAEANEDLEEEVEEEMD